MNNSQTVLKHLSSNFENIKILRQKYAQLPPNSTVHYPSIKVTVCMLLKNYKPRWNESMKIKEHTQRVQRRWPLQNKNLTMKIKNWWFTGEKTKPFILRNRNNKKISQLIKKRRSFASTPRNSCIFFFAGTRQPLAWVSIWLWLRGRSRNLYEKRG